MQYTPNFNLAKPEDNETADIADLNANADKVDTELKKLSTEKASGEDLANHSADTTKHIGTAAKTTPVDADALSLADSADGSKLKRLTWANLKARLGGILLPAPHKNQHAIGGTDALAPADIGASNKSTIVTTTLTAASWTGTSAPYSYTFSNASITTTCPVELLPGAAITQAQLEMLQAANIQGGTQAAGSIQLSAWGDKPTANLPVQFIIRGDL